MYTYISAEGIFQDKTMKILDRYIHVEDQNGQVFVIPVVLETYKDEWELAEKSDATTSLVMVATQNKIL